MDTVLLIALGGLALAAIIVFIIYMFKPRSTEEAIEVAGPRRGRVDYIAYDPSTDEEVINKRYRCPNCDTDIMYEEDECPSCGVRFKKDQFECPSCGKDVDPREKECPYCGEILLEEPFVCPNCSNPVNPDATACERCNAKFWSPIRLDQRTLERRRRPVNEEAPSEIKEAPKEVQRDEPYHPGRGRRVR